MCNAVGPPSLPALGIVPTVSGELPRSPRIASPGFHRSVGGDVLLVLVVAIVLAVTTPAAGTAFLVGGLLAGGLAFRRTSLGAYEGEDALVIRNVLATRVLPWRDVISVKVIRDPVIPWLRVPVVILRDGRTVPVTGLRHTGEPTDDVLSLTRLVRERRDGLSREVW